MTHNYCCVNRSISINVKILDYLCLRSLNFIDRLYASLQYYCSIVSSFNSLIMPNTLSYYLLSLIFSMIGAPGFQILLQLCAAHHLQKRGKPQLNISSIVYLTGDGLVGILVLFGLWVNFRKMKWGLSQYLNAFLKFIT